MLKQSRKAEESSFLTVVFLLFKIHRDYLSTLLVCVAQFAFSKSCCFRNLEYQVGLLLDLDLSRKPHVCIYILNAPPLDPE